MNIQRSLWQLFLFFAFALHSSLPVRAEGLFNSLKDSLASGVKDVLNSASFMKKQENHLVDHLNNVTVVDYMKSGFPKVRMGHRVADLFHGWHFDDILMDSPDSIRPASVVVFFNSSDAQCMKDYNALDWDSIAQTKLPARSKVFTSRYDMYSAPRRTWYEFTPEMDLEKRFDVKKCPEVVFTSRKCDGFTEWCVRGPDEEDPAINVLGCDNFKESCPSELRKVWNGKGDLAEWIKQQIKADGNPKLTKFLGSYHEQGRWIQKREYTTCTTHLRNSFLSQAFPAFTDRGFKVLKIPDELQEWLLDFVKEHEAFRKTEFWNSESTQMSFHEKPTTFIDMDRVRRKKEAMANKYLKPLLEEWAQMKPLELTSFYGMREYHEGAWLRQHIDRIDTHVLSVTLSVAKKNFTFDKDGTHDYKPWPLQVTDWTGKQVAYDHPAGTMILYESSKLPHGRPTRNNGGIHLGCFVHYKPMNMHGSEAEKWDQITSIARKNMQAHSTYARFKATEEIEPAESEIEFAEINVGEGSSWKKLGEADEEPDASDGFSVTLKNGSERPLSVYWYHSSQAKPVFQGTAGIGASFSLTSYHGHTFFWAEEGSDEPVVGGKFTIDIGKKVYNYNMKKDGSVNK